MAPCCSKVSVIKFRTEVPKVILSFLIDPRNLNVRPSNLGESILVKQTNF